MEFSVSICVYGKDNADHFKIAMESITNQTIPPTEIVLVVDGPIPELIQTVIQDIQSKCEYLKVVYLKNRLSPLSADNILAFLPQSYFYVDLRGLPLTWSLYEPGFTPLGMT